MELCAGINNVMIEDLSFQSSCSMDINPSERQADFEDITTHFLSIHTVFTITFQSNNALYVKTGCGGCPTSYIWDLFSQSIKSSTRNGCICLILLSELSRT